MEKKMASNLEYTDSSTAHSWSVCRLVCVLAEQVPRSDCTFSRSISATSPDVLVPDKSLLSEAT